MWTPKNINNCLLWLDASQISGTNGQQITVWNDLSGNNLNMMGTSNLSTNICNNKNVLSLSTSQYMYLNHTFGNPCTTIALERLSSLPGARLLTGYNNNWLLGYWNNCEDEGYAEGWITSQSQKSATTNWNIYSMIQTGSLSTVMNKKNIVVSNSGGLSSPNGLAINAGIDGSEKSNCQFAEIILYNRALSTIEINNVIDYLNWKWLGAKKPTFIREFLIQDGTNLDSTDGIGLNNYGSLPYTENVFDTYGVDNLNNMNNIVISKIINQKYNMEMLK